jgi:nucleoside-diphosphate-sugar epimerase/predicted dehydrogenase
MPEPGQILILGAGAVTRELFLPALSKLGLTGRTTVADASAAVADLASQYPGLRGIQRDFREYLEQAPKGEFACAIVALPNALHEEAVVRAVDQGLPVLCEKPLALSRRACLDMGRAAEGAGCMLAVNMVRRLLPGVRSARLAVDLGMIGALESIDIEHGSAYAWPARSLAPFRRENGGLLADMGVHYLDLAEMFLGRLSPLAYEDDARGGVEADLTYELQSGSGSRARIRLSRLRTLRNTVALTGERGRLEWGVDDGDECTLTVVNHDPVELRQAGGRASSLADCFAQQIEDFLERVRLGKPPLVGARNAAETAALIEWAYAERRPARIFPAGTEAPGPSLVTGATSFIGFHLVERLFERGVSEVVAAARSPLTCARIARFPARLELVDLLDARSVRQAMRGVRRVFHLAYGRDGAARREVTVEGTKNVVNAAIEEGCESVVILSTAYVFGRPAGIVDETRPYQPDGGEYGASKAEMERWCLARARSSGPTRLVVLNPSCVYGPWGGAYSELPASLARGQAFCWIESGIGSANYNFVGNLVDAILLASEKPEAHGQRFLINDGVTTWREFLGPFVEPWQKEILSYTKQDLLELELETRDGVLKAMRKLSASPDVRRIVKRTAVGAAAVALANRYFPSAIPRGAPGGASGNNGLAKRASETTAPPQPPCWLADLYGNSSTAYSSEKAKSILGWRPAIDLAEGQRRTVEHLDYLHSPHGSAIGVAVSSSALPLPDSRGSVRNRAR